MSLLDRLRPTAQEVGRLALRETDPAHCDEFEPLTRGPLFAVAVIVYVAILTAVVTPFRLVTRAFGR